MKRKSSTQDANREEPVAERARTNRCVNTSRSSTLKALLVGCVGRRPLKRRGSEIPTEANDILVNKGGNTGNMSSRPF